jgi:ATF/CREB family transcription factor
MRSVAETPLSATMVVADDVEDPTVDSKQDGTVKLDIPTTAPLAPPPRPGVTAPTTIANTPDYFSVAHSGSHLSYETNPFEHQFAGGDGSVVQTPGGTKLPGVSALTSPSGLLGAGSTSNFWGGLRTGPLSPAMLSGPQKDDYFSDGHHLRGGFPTPNESSMRSGLTPGGGGSMFPEPSPNSQALYNQLASGGATPSTLEFHRTAMSAAAAQKREAPPAIQKNITSQPADLGNTLEVKPPTGQFDQHDANDAANGLFLLAQARSGPQNTNHYAMAAQMNAHAHPQPAISMQGHSTEPSPTMSNHIHNGSISTNSARAASEASEENGSQSRPNTRGKGKKGAANGRRKAEETPSKAPANKKSKGNNGRAISEEPQMSEEELDMSKEEFNANGKKMTDEEKRKNFLERNRYVLIPTW